MQDNALQRNTLRGLRWPFSHPRTRFVTKYLDPADRLEEVLCGLIMVLDFTFIAGLTAGAGKQGVRHLLIAALGCNVAWGIIDGVLYVAGNLTARRQRFHLLSKIRNAPDESAAFSAISDHLAPLLEPATSTEDLALRDPACYRKSDHIHDTVRS